MRDKRTASVGERHVAAFVRVFLAAVWLILAISDGIRVIESSSPPWDLLLFAFAVSMCVRSAFKAWCLR